MNPGDRWPTTRRAAIRALAGLAGLAGCAGRSDSGWSGSLAALGPGKLYKAPTCACCDRYAAYLEARGLPVTVEAVDDRDAVWTVHGIPADLRSCHTLRAEPYVIEGHVPGVALAALVDDRPDIVGVALPGMPAGSPGMGGRKAAPFVVRALHRDGPSTVFMEV